MNILVIGTGAVGSFYGSLLARQGADVSVMARSDYSFIREQGIDVHSETALGDYHFHPVAVLKPGEVPLNQPDYVLLCTKVVEGADRVGLLRSVVGSETRIVLISNGVEIEAAIRQAYPQQALISGLAFVCVSRIAPGKSGISPRADWFSVIFHPDSRRKPGLWRMFSGKAVSVVRRHPTSSRHVGKNVSGMRRLIPFPSCRADWIRPRCSKPANPSFGY